MKANHLLVWCAAILVLVGELLGDIQPPRFRFDHINRDGTLYFSEVWFEIDAGGDWKLPLAVNFDNTRTESSPYLGKGWRVALFESHVIKKDEKTFFVIMPSGYKYKFVRKAPELYESTSGWTWIGTPDDFILKPTCGDEYLTFKDGKLKSLFCGKRAFECVRDDQGLVKALVDPKTGEFVVECQLGPKGGLERLKFSGGEEIAIEQSLSESPPSSAQGENQPVSSLSRMSRKKRKTVKEYRSYIEEGGKVAGLRIESNHGLAKDFRWDIESKKVLSDGKWNYLIEQKGKDFSQTRTDKNGVKQQWFDNRTEGYEVLAGFSHSPEFPTRTFYYTKANGVPAALFHHTRKIEEERDGRWETVKTFSHDAKARVIGEIDHKAGTDVRTEFDEKGAATRKIHDLSGKLIKTVRLNEKNQPLEMEFSDPPEVVTYTYGSDGALVGRTSTTKSIAQAPEPQAVPALLERGLKYVAVGESVYPPEGMALHSELGTDPRNFSARFAVKYDSLGPQSLFDMEEWNGFDASMQRVVGGSDGKTHYCYMPEEDSKSLAVTLDRDVATELYRNFSRMEFVTLPFGLFLKQGKDHMKPRWREGKDIAHGLESISAEAKRHPGKKEFAITRDFEGTIWRAAFATGNLYPKGLVIESDGVPLFKWQVTQWGDNLGPMTFPKEIQTTAYRKGVPIRNTKVTIQSIGISEATNFAVPYEQATQVRDLDTDTFFATRKSK